jgi:hypothetical protein
MTNRIDGTDVACPGLERRQSLERYRKHHSVHGRYNHRYHDFPGVTDLSPLTAPPFMEEPCIASSTYTKPSHGNGLDNNAPRIIGSYSLATRYSEVGTEGGGVNPPTCDGKKGAVALADRWSPKSMLVYPTPKFGVHLRLHVARGFED